MKGFIGRQKYRFTQGYAWIGAPGVGFLVAAALQRHYPFQGTPMYVLFPIGLVLVWSVGFLVIRFGLYAEEVRFANLQNPVIRKIYDEANKK